jgi:hypothetical protein
MAHARWYKNLEKVINELPETTPTTRKGLFASEPNMTSSPDPGAIYSHWNKGIL